MEALPEREEQPLIGGTISSTERKRRNILVWILLIITVILCAVGLVLVIQISPLDHTTAYGVYGAHGSTQKHKDEGGQGPADPQKRKDKEKQGPAEPQKQKDQPQKQKDQPQKQKDQRKHAPKTTTTPCEMVCNYNCNNSWNCSAPLVYRPFPELIICDDRSHDSDDDALCTDEKCCNLFCDTFTCANTNLELNQAASDIVCPVSGCDDAKCCVPKTCASANYSCEGPWADKTSPSMIVCDATGCTNATCCDLFCNTYTCPQSRPLNPSANRILCPVTGCTDALCCNCGTGRRRQMTSTLKFQEANNMCHLLAWRLQGGEGDGFPESKLESRLQDLVRLMCDVNMRKQMLEVGYDEKKMPLGKLSKDTIKRGYQVLKKFEAELTANRPPVPVLSTGTLLRENQVLEMIESSEISLATKVLKAERTENAEPEHPIDAHYAALKCPIRAVDQAENEWQVIAKYLAQTQAPTQNEYTLELLDLFAVDREADRLAFQTYESTPNRQLLWHGSPLTNFIGIVSQGLRIPEGPLTGPGDMFGKGLYFADMVSKAASYCDASKENPVALLLLCEVALGHPKSLFMADPEADAKLGDALSVFGEGQIGPIPEEAVYLPDGVLVPSGNCAPRKLPQPASLHYNEYVVYDAAQVRMRYLVKVKFNFHSDTGEVS